MRCTDEGICKMMGQRLRRGGGRRGEEHFSTSFPRWSDERWEAEKRAASVINGGDGGRRRRWAVGSRC